MTTFAPDQTDFYLGDPHAAFRRMRAEAPFSWYEAGGFWCVTKHADLQYVSRTPKLFSSAQGTQLFEVKRSHSGDPELVGGAQSIIRMDPPEHNRHRKLVIQGFTLRQIAKLEPRIREITVRALEAIPLGERVDFVDSVAIPTPMLVIAELLGVPPSDHESFRRWSDAIILAGSGGVDETSSQAIGDLFAYFSKALEEHRVSPRDDVISVLLGAEIDGDRLTEPEILIFLMTLLVAGNETVRSLISVGTLALLDHPDQLEAMRARPELIPNAVEELLRYVTPIQTFVRRATQDTELRDQKIREGDYLTLFYGSANRDEEVFGDDSDALDIEREDARRHLSFGFGEHLCLGASLARMEGRIVFEELLARMPRFALDGAAERQPSVLANALVRMPVVFESG